MTIDHAHSNHWHSLGQNWISSDKRLIMQIHSNQSYHITFRCMARITTTDIPLQTCPLTLHRTVPHQTCLDHGTNQQQTLHTCTSKVQAKHKQSTSKAFLNHTTCMHFCLTNRQKPGSALTSGARRSAHSLTS